MAQKVAVMAGGSKGSGTKPVARINHEGSTMGIMPGVIKKDVVVPFELWRSGPTTVRVTNTTIHKIRVGRAIVDVGKSHVPASHQWLKVEIVE